MGPWCKKQIFDNDQALAVVLTFRFVHSHKVTNLSEGYTERSSASISHKPEWESRDGDQLSCFSITIIHVDLGIELEGLKSCHLVRL